MNAELIRVESREVVEIMASQNHVEPTSSQFAASVKLGDVIYFWSAA